MTSKKAVGIYVIISFFIGGLIGFIAGGYISFDPTTIHFGNNWLDGQAGDISSRFKILKNTKEARYPDMANLQLKSFKKAGIFSVTFDADSRYTAPYSKRECLWYDSIFVKEESQKERGYTHLERSMDNILYAKTVQGRLEIFPNHLNPYLLPSFTGKQIIDDEEVYIEEYIIEADRPYYAKVTSFKAHLPPLWFIPRSRKIYLLDIYGEYPVEGKPRIPLVPTFRGRTG